MQKLQASSQKGAPRLLLLNRKNRFIIKTYTKRALQVFLPLSVDIAVQQGALGIEKDVFHLHDPTFLLAFSYGVSYSTDGLLRSFLTHYQQQQDKGTDVSVSSSNSATTTATTTATTSNTNSNTSSNTSIDGFLPALLFRPHKLEGGAAVAPVAAVGPVGAVEVAEGRTIISSSSSGSSISSINSISGSISSSISSSSSSSSMGRASASNELLAGSYLQQEVDAYPDLWYGPSNEEWWQGIDRVRRDLVNH